ncbi:MAG TPA: type 4a pilus biogenesis protein PilO [Steroidobacteraceae bacterium]|nr:type 4a pilus biogenesis protein PilO [Steroidobacteraceae bacterium]
MDKILEQLRQLDPNDPGRWPLPFRLAAVVLIFVIATGFSAYFLAYQDEQPVLDQARAKEQTLLDTLKQKAGKAANLDAYKAQLKEMERSFGAMLRQLPNKTEVPNLLVDISQTGLAAGLDEKLFQPGQEIKKDFYAELPIKIRLTGGYHAIGTFVSGIAALPRIVTIHDVQIEPAGGKGSYDQLQFDLVAKTYRYLDEEEQAAAGRGKQKGRAK